MNGTMLSAVYLGKEQVALRQVPIPQPGPRDVLIRNICSSICGTDAAVFRRGPGTGHRITAGGEFGHETVSRVAAVDTQVTEFRVGQRVYPYPRFAKGNTRRAGTIGGLSEYILILEAKAGRSLYPVPDVSSDRAACRIEPFTVGCRAARRSMPKEGQHAVVFGCSTIGAAAAIALKWFGVKKVLVCDLSALRLSIMEQLGFAICNMECEDFVEKAVSYFGAAPALGKDTADIDIFIDAAGAERVLDLFMETGKIESRFVSVAVNNAIRKLDLLHLTYAQKSIIGSGGYMPEDVAEIFAMMQSGRWNIPSPITHQFPLRDIETALRTAAEPGSALNVVIEFTP